MPYKISTPKAKEQKNLSIPKKVFYIGLSNKKYSRTYGGFNADLDVYELKNGQFELIGTREICSRSYKGEEGEAMNVLRDNKKITDAEFELSSNKNGSGGYYRRDLHNFEIRQLPTSE